MDGLKQSEVEVGRVIVLVVMAGESVRKGEKAVVMVTEVVILMEMAVVVEEMVLETEVVVLAEGVMTVVRWT